MKSEQRCGIVDYAKLRDAPGIDKQRRDPEHDAIKRREIGGSLSGSIANQQLMLEFAGSAACMLYLPHGS